MMMASHHENEAQWSPEWDTMFTAPKIPLEDFDDGSEEEVADSPQDSNLRPSEKEIDMMFSPDESESSRGDEEQGTENSNSAKSSEAKEGDVDSSLPESHTSFEFPHADPYAHAFSLSPFTRVNFAFDEGNHGHGHAHAVQIKTEPEDLPIAPVFDPSAHYKDEVHSSQIEDEIETGDGGEIVVKSEPDASVASPSPSQKRSRVRLHHSRLSRPSARSGRKVQVKSETKVFTGESSLGYVSEVVRPTIPRASFKTREQRTFTCTTCKATFNRQSHLERHNLSHTGERPFPCVMEGCGKAFTRKEHLKRHIDNTHASATPSSCTKCGKPFKDSWSLRKHLKAKHLDD